MSYTVKINPDATRVQSDIIPNATEFTDGICPAWLVRLVNSLVPAEATSKSFLYEATGAEGTDFFIDLPLSMIQSSTDYVVQLTYATPNVFVSIGFSYDDNELARFRVVTDVQLAAGVLISCSVQRRTAI